MADLGSNTSLVTALAEIEKKVVQAEIDRDNLETNIRNMGVDVVPGTKITALVEKIPEIKAFPSGWDVERTGKVVQTDIKEGDAVIHYKVPLIEDGVMLSIDQPKATSTQKAVSRQPIVVSDSGEFIAYKYSIETNQTFIGVNYRYPDGRYVNIPIVSPYDDTVSAYAFDFRPGTNQLYVSYYNKDNIYRYDLTNNTSGINPTTVPTPGVYRNISSLIFSSNGKIAMAQANVTSSSYGVALLDVSNDSGWRVLGSDTPNAGPILFGFNATSSYCYYTYSNRVYAMDTTSFISSNIGISISSPNYGRFAPGTNYLYIPSYSSPYLQGFDLSVPTSAKKIPNPSIIPNYEAVTVSSDSSGSYLVVGVDTASTDGSMFIYKINSSDGSLTKMPSTTTSKIVAGTIVVMSAEGKLIWHARSHYQNPTPEAFEFSAENHVAPFDGHVLSVVASSKNKIAGVSLENKNIGGQCKVNTFPKLNIT